MTDEQSNTNEGGAPGAWADIVRRFKRGERETLLAAGALCVAALQFLIGAAGGTLITFATFANLGLLGWLANTAWARRRAGEGSGLFVLVCVGAGLAAVGTFWIASGLGMIVEMGRAFESMEL